MSAANTDKFRKTSPRKATTLSGSVSSGDTTIACTSLTGWPTDTAVDVVINRVDSNGTVQQTWETVTAVVSGSNLTSALRGVEGTASAWGAGTVVEILWTAAQWNDAVDAFLEEHDQDGSHGGITGSSVVVTGNVETSGGAVVTNTVSEKTAGAGVTADGVLLKDGEVITDTIKEATVGLGTAFPNGVVWDGWQPAGVTFAYSAASPNGVALITGIDLTAIFIKGVKIRLAQSTGGTKYFVIGGSQFTGGNTVLTFIATTDYTLVNEAIADVYYSRMPMPVGFPARFNYATTITPSGSMTFSDDGNAARWTPVMSSLLYIYFNIRGTTGGSASNALSATLPIPKNGAGRINAAGFAFAADSNFVAGFGTTSDGGGATSINLHRYDSSNYTLAGGSGWRGSFMYHY